ncbi:MarR family winged helix-turn-helix transcriptional regulator [Ammoniphilus sp. 3BR4]|uniref:MarR family winged helix-turn-helix transcriptional regulator n=1 Tax=Ammoniphilus sp. 3BR4 TaxID=3158265 RepID=UPI003466FAF7
MNLDQSLGFLINNAGRRISQLLTIHFQPFGITPEQWTVLNRLAEQDGINQKDLSLRVGKDQTNVARIFDQLERKGLAKRKPNPEDRRSFLAVLTEEGRLLNEKLTPIEQEVIQSALTGLPDQQVEQLKKWLKQITDQSTKLIKEMER